MNRLNPPTNAIHPPEATEQALPPVEDLHPQPTPSHQCHRAIPVLSAQRRRGVVTPGATVPTTKTRVERGGGTVEVGLPRVVECVRRPRVGENAFTSHHLPNKRAGFRKTSRGGVVPSVPKIGHDKQIASRVGGWKATSNGGFHRNDNNNNSKTEEVTNF